MGEFTDMTKNLSLYGKSSPIVDSNVTESEVAEIAAWLTGDQVRRLPEDNPGYDAVVCHEPRHEDCHRVRYFAFSKSLARSRDSNPGMERLQAGIRVRTGLTRPLVPNDGGYYGLHMPGDLVRALQVIRRYADES